MNVCVCVGSSMIQVQTFVSNVGGVGNPRFLRSFMRQLDFHVQEGTELRMHPQRQRGPNVPANGPI